MFALLYAPLTARINPPNWARYAGYLALLIVFAALWDVA